LYIAGANTIEGFSYKDLNGEFWRYKYSANLNYPLSNIEDLGREFSMFASSTATPQLVIIGKNSRLVFSYYGYVVEDDIRAAIETALKEFGDLQQIEKLDNVFLNTSELSVDLSQKFISLGGYDISYSADSISNPGVVNAEIISNVLTLSRGGNTGISEIELTAATSSDTVKVSFKVMAYPDGSQVVGFEDAESWSDHFYYLGDAVWQRDQSYVFEGLYSLRSGDIPAPEIEDAVSWTLARVEFISDRDDTLAFAYKISSQLGSDGFEFCVDGTAIEFPDGKWSGEVDWAFAEIPVKAGKHSIDWDYFKWEYGFAGKDAAWIDLLRIPGILSGIETGELSEGFDLISSYPNPFNSLAVLTFNLRSESAPVLKVYNLKGELLFEKFTGNMMRGLNTFKIDLNGFDSGTYFCRIKAGGQVLNGKILYLK